MTLKAARLVSGNGRHRLRPSGRRKRPRPGPPRCGENLCREGKPPITRCRRGGNQCHRWVRLAKQGKRVVPPEGRRPFIFGRGGERKSETLAEHNVPFEVVPGVCRLRLRFPHDIPLTHRDHSANLRLRHRPPPRTAASIWTGRRSPGRTRPSSSTWASVVNGEICRQLMSNGLPPASGGRRATRHPRGVSGCSRPRSARWRRKSKKTSGRRRWSSSAPSSRCNRSWPGSNRARRHSARPIASNSA